jgi:hypothetical protein
MSRLRKRQNAIQTRRDSEGVRISSCMDRYSPEKTQQVWSTHTPGVSHQGSKGESNSTICISATVYCLRLRVSMSLIEEVLSS